MYDKLVYRKQGMPALPAVVPHAEETFASLGFEDKWKEASMVSVCRYLRGGKSLQVPTSFRSMLPERL